jgi:hypothetical protein
MRSWRAVIERIGTSELLSRDAALVGAYVKLRRF